jgi:hypothetical protein
LAAAARLGLPGRGDIMGQPRPQPTAVATTSSRPQAGDLEMTPGRPFVKGVSGVISGSAAAGPVSFQAALRPARRDSQKS